jgi:transcriptional regulator with XRE-family HTH domain
MTAEVVRVFPIGERADETVRRSIRALIEGRDLRKDDVAEAVGMTKATLYRRLGGHGSVQAFTAGEVATVAAYFGVSIESIYTGLGGAFLPPDGGSVSGLPRLDSNQQPAGYGHTERHTLLSGDSDQSHHRLAA